MKIEEMKTIWEQQNAQIEESITINKKLILKLQAENFKSSKRKLMVLPWLDTVFNLVVISALGAFIGGLSINNPHFYAGLSLMLMFITLIIYNIVHLTKIDGLDFSDDIVNTQKKLLNLKHHKAKMLFWLLLASPFMAITAKFVIALGFFDYDLFNSPFATWAKVSIAFGIVFPIICLGLRRIFSVFFEKHQIKEKFISGITGGDYNDIEESIKELKEFGG